MSARRPFKWLGPDNIDPMLAQLRLGAAVVAAVLTLVGQATYSSVGVVPSTTFDLLTQFTSNQLARLAYGGALGGGAAVATLFLWPVLFRVLHDDAPGWALVGFILAVSGSALTIIGFGATQWMMPLYRAVHDGGLDPKIAGAVGDAFTGVSRGVILSSFVVLGAGFAAFSIAMLRTRLFPRELGWFAATLAIILVMQTALPNAGVLYE